MSSSWYTNKLRVLAEAENTKVQYPGRIENTNPLLPVKNCTPNFNTLNYVIVKCNVKNKNCST